MLNRPIDLNALGRHVLLELNGCEHRMLTDAETLEQTLVSAAEAAGAHVVETVFHQFSPHGLSGVVVIAESHITVHTWPEYGYAAVDVFTCGAPEMADQICQIISTQFKAESTSTQALNRGLNLPPQMQQIAK
ncbi:MAG: adenosylmethionine decarboxylase [Opitutaceae bacterium]